MDKAVDKGLDKNINLTANKQSKLGFIKKEMTPVAEQAGIIIGEPDYDLSGLPPKIKDSKHFDCYFEWIKSDWWSVRQCENQAQAQFGENISYETFSKAKKLMRERGYVIPNYKASILKGVEAPEFDVIQEMRNILALSFKKIAEYIEKEKTMQDKIINVPYILKAVGEEQDRATQGMIALFAMEMKKKEFEFQRNMKLGLIEDGQTIDIEAQSIPTEHEVKQIVSTFTQEQAYSMNQALMWAKKVYLLDLPEWIDIVAVEEYAEAILSYDLHAKDDVKVIEQTDWAKEILWFGMSQEIRIIEWMTARVV